LRNHINHGKPMTFMDQTVFTTAAPRRRQVRVLLPSAGLRVIAALFMGRWAANRGM
jgi:hypothetical protein